MTLIHIFSEISRQTEVAYRRIDGRDAEPRKSSLAYRRNALALLFFVAAAVLWAATFTTARFEKRDAYDYAQLGRQIHSHQGFSTRQIFPRYVPYLAEKGYLHAEQWPSLHRAHPALPVVSAGIQLVIPDPIEASVVATGLFFVLSVPLLFLLAVRLTDLKTASLATLTFLSDPRLVRAAYDGMTESLAILLTLLPRPRHLSSGDVQGQGRILGADRFFSAAWSTSPGPS